MRASGIAAIVSAALCAACEEAITAPPTGDVLVRFSVTAPGFDPTRVAFTLKIDGRTFSGVGVTELRASGLTAGPHQLTASMALNVLPATRLGWELDCYWPRSGGPPWVVTVPAGATLELTLQAACSAPGGVLVTVTATGADLPGSVVIHRNVPEWFPDVFPVPLGLPTAIGPMPPGRHVLDLISPQNCTVDGPTRFVDVLEDVLVPVSFLLRCEPLFI